MTLRQQAEAIEQFGDDLAALNRAFDEKCRRMQFSVVQAIDHIPHQQFLDTVAEEFRRLGDQLCRQCDEAEEADDRRRANPLEPAARALGQGGEE